MSVSWMPLLLSLMFFLTACGASHKLSQKTAHKTIRQLGLIELKDRELEIQKITQSGNHQAVVEANLQMAFLMSPDSEGTWSVKSFRLADRNWVNVKTFLRALELIKTQQTRKDLNNLAAGLRKFKLENGHYPIIKKLVDLADVLFPRYMSTLARYDGWGRELILQHNSKQSLTIVSLGTDSIRNTADDIVISP